MITNRAMSFYLKHVEIQRRTRWQMSFSFIVKNRFGSISNTHTHNQLKVLEKWYWIKLITLMPTFKKNHIILLSWGNKCFKDSFRPTVEIFQIESKQWNSQRTFVACGMRRVSCGCFWERKNVHFFDSLKNEI